MAKRQHNQRIDGIRLIAHEVDGARSLGGGVAQRLQSRLRFPLRVAGDGRNRRGAPGGGGYVLLLDLILELQNDALRRLFADTRRAGERRDIPR